MRLPSERASALAALLACTCPDLGRVEQVGEADPGADEVIRDANTCGWTGQIEWVADDVTCGGRQASGCYLYFECPQRIVVTRFGNARRSALAHELGHACGTIPFD